MTSRLNPYQEVEGVKVRDRPRYRMWRLKWELGEAVRLWHHDLRHHSDS
jgi:hypothetical protein